MEHLIDVFQIDSFMLGIVFAIVVYSIALLLNETVAARRAREERKRRETIKEESE